MSAADFIWAKLNPYKSLIHHMIDTGACAIILLNTCFQSSSEKMADATGLSKSEVISLSAYCAALHDIGKCHPAFQVKAKDSDPGTYKTIKTLMPLTGIRNDSFRHELYSERVLKRIWTLRDIPSDVIENIGTVISLHHQGKTGNGKEPIPAIRTIYQNEQDHLEKRINNLFPNKIQDLTCEDWSSFCILLEGIIICSDWISSDHWFENLPEAEDRKYFEIALKTAKKAISEIGIAETASPEIHNMQDLFPFITEEHARPMQKAVSDLEEVPCFAILEDITGSGKTEAAVYLASRMQKEFHKHGLYFALPTSATSNQMYYRLEEVFKRFDLPDFKLLHGTAWAVESSDKDFDNRRPGTETIGSEWLSPARKGMLAENAVGTVDQAMMAVLRIKYSVLRLLGLSEKVLIVDEVHAYDAYMSDIIERLLMWCSDLGIPVILMSATLPLKKKGSLINAYCKGSEISSNAYPLLTALYPDGKIKEIPVDPFRRSRCSFEIKYYLNDCSMTAELAVGKIRNGGNICVMANTIKDARKIYEEIRRIADPSIQVMLFHACFTVEERNKVEKECLLRYGKNGRRPQKSILVSTQVVEQSLDIDFDEMITQIAPIDLLIQRVGRVHRHENSRPASMRSPKLIILADPGEKHDSGSYYVYAPFILQKTMKYLEDKEKSEISMPEDLREAVEIVYSSIPEDMNDESWQKLVFSDQQKQNNAAGHEIGVPYRDTFYEVEDRTEAAMWEEDPGDCDPKARTRDGKDSVRIVLANEKLYQKYLDDWSNPEVQKEMLLHSASLSIRKEELPEPESRGRMKGYFICHSSSNIFKLTDSITLIDDTEYGVIIRNEKGPQNTSAA